MSYFNFQYQKELGFPHFKQKRTFPYVFFWCVIEKKIFPDVSVEVQQF